MLTLSRHRELFCCFCEPIGRSSRFHYVVCNMNRLMHRINIYTKQDHGKIFGVLKRRCT